jgi:polyvinyl alcohol dehydrogenase (cytochrome)
MTVESKPSTARALRLGVWVVFAVAFAFLYYRYSSLFGAELTQLAASSVWLAYALYVVLGALRGFALIPVTNLVVLAIPLFQPVPLLALTLIGIAISSACIYAFADSLKLGQYLERKHARHIERLQNALRRNPTSIVTAWSFLPIVPTDLICYVCGVMKISFRRFMLGVLVGEGAICAIYIFAGASLLDLGKRVFGVDAAEAQEAAAQLSGQAVYAEHCALCHEQVDERIPHRSALQQLPAARIVRALDAGAMLAIAMTMNRDERIAVAEYLGTDAPDSGPPASAYCADRTLTLRSTPSAASWNGWSPTPDNARYQTAERAALSAEQVPSLELKWAYGFGGDVTAFAAPTIVDGHVFVGSAGGLVQALSADSGCLKWTFQAPGPVRAAPLVARGDARRNLLLLGDFTGWYYALDAATGELVWKTQIETHDSTRLTGAAAVHDGVAYVPVSSWEESRSGDPDYPCCTFRGSVVAVRVRDGTQLWRTYMTDPPREVGKNARGAPLSGPSGAAIWSTPTVDAARGLLYVTTGDNYTLPATPTSDAVVALALADGRIAWTKQTTPNDVYNSSCQRDHRSNCPFESGPDVDFGSSAILLPGGERLLAGQKSGIVYALDATKQGEILWQTRVGEGGLNGGVQWGMATDGTLVYAATSDVGRTRWAGDPFDTRRYILDPKRGGGLTALRVADGSRAWHAPAAPCPDGAPAGCSPAQPGAVTLIPGVVFATSNDGHVRAHAAGDGRVLWDFDTAREFATVNGVTARGGSLDGQGVVVADGLVLVASGYPRNGGMPGNVLLAFRAD